ncbi:MULTISPECIES: hypothetical protein [Streptomyces]|uniref:hypothetical protein n=1 Tax=Streptomyces TaxID=1883 RepID=UPI0006AF56D2|nr:hypothetical protein [Streptomyces sp. WM6378]KOU43182.1 hypothetical protein ADK54_17805 [Streptomyces sp. WM6378]
MTRMTAADRRFERELRRDKDLARWWYRHEFFQWLIDDDPENLEGVDPAQVDEEVLERDGTGYGKVLAPWLARGLLAHAGCYAEAGARRASRLPALLIQRADAALAGLAGYRSSSPDGSGYYAARYSKEVAELYELAWEVTCAVRQEQHAPAASDLPRAA